MASRSPDSYPANVQPQLTKLVKQPPDGDEWLHEIKHDGYRLLAYLDRGKVRLITRGGFNWTARFPDIVKEVAALHARQAILDGELCAIEPGGRTSFHKLQSVLPSKNRSSLVLFVFDLLYLDGHDLRRRPLVERKAALAELLSFSPRKRLAFVDSIRGDGREFFLQCCTAGLEGIVSKRLEQPYRSGRADWLKCKCNIEEVLVIGGFTYGQTKKKLGELLMGRRRGRWLEYAGRVAFGLSGQELLPRLEAMRQDKCPFSDKLPRDG